MTKDNTFLIRGGKSKGPLSFSLLRYQDVIGLQKFNQAVKDKSHSH